MNFKAVATALFCATSLAHAQVPDSGFGSYGQFDPKHFIENETPWIVFRAVGKVNKSGYPCDGQGGTCMREKDYVLTSVRSQVRRTGINVGVPTTLAQIFRRQGGTATRIELKEPSGIVLLRADGTRSASRLGFDAAASHTLARINGLYSSADIATVETKDAAWARLNPISAYEMAEGQAKFKVTAVKKTLAFGLFRNFVRNTPMQEQIKDGTIWCDSNSWRLTQTSVEGLFKNDEIDMNACEGRPLMESRTKIDSLGRVFQNYFLSRQDSTVTLSRSGSQYQVEAKTDWFCPFDCDGSVYRMAQSGSQRSVMIASDRFNFLSSTGLKIKVVMVDWDGDGFNLDPHNVDLKGLAQNPSLQRDVVAVIATEVTDANAVTYNNGQWTERTLIMFPPRSANPAHNADRRDQAMKYNIRLLDSLLAMMPDQVQMSPELKDAEEKLDELRVILRLQGANGSRSIEQLSADLALDIFTDIDVTTTPGLNGNKGKVQWAMSELGWR